MQSLLPNDLGADFLTGSGEMAERIRSKDWSKTSLGPISGWPQSLKTITSFLIQSPVPIVLLWGEDGVMIYNDAYSVFAGGRHPQLLGSKVREGWPEVADFNDNVMRVGLAGGTLAYRDQELTLHRHGRPEQVWMNLDYSPVLSESGKPGGVIAIVVETTNRVLAERQLAGERDRLAQMFAQAPSFMALLAGPSHVLELANPDFLKLVYHRPVIGRSIAEALPEVVEQGFVDLLDQVYRTGESYSAQGARVDLQQEAGGPLATHYLDFVYQPVTNPSGAVTGIFVQGVNVTARVIAEQRREALVRLTDKLREVDTFEQAEFETARILGEAIEASRVGYGAMDIKTETVTIKHDWTAPGVSSIAGVHQMRHYGSFIDTLKAGELIVINDIDQHPGTAPAASAIRGLDVQAFVNIPVMEKGRMVALLYVHDTRKRIWSADEVAFISEIASRTRMASERLRNAAALRESEARLRFLDELGIEVSNSFDADEVMAITTRRTGQHLGVSICAYADVDQDEDGFTIRGDWSEAGSPSIVGRYRLKDFGALAVSRLHAGQPLIINDTDVEIEPHEAATFQAIGIRATICMPLVKDGRLTALMAIHDKSPRVWTDPELAMIHEVTERSWAHIERVAGAAALRAESRKFETLNRTGQAIASELDLQKVVQMVTDAGVELTGAEFGAFFYNVFDQRGGSYMLYALSGADRSKFETFPMPRATQVFAPTFRGDGVVRSDDIRQDPRYGHNAPRKGIPEGHLPVRSYLAVPVVSRSGEVIGGLFFGHSQPSQFNVRHENLLVGIAAQAATAIDNARLYRDLQQAKETLEQRIEEEMAERIKAEDALRQSQKMEAIGQLTGGLAHDFNNLLAGISGSLEVLEKRIHGGRLSEAQRFIDAARASTARAASLTQRLLAFSRRQTLDPKATDVNRLILGMDELVRRTVGPGIEVEIVGAGGLWTVFVDGPQLENALLNLCINARDAMPDGGRITIETANKWLDERAARERELPPGQYISLCVTDTGTGMPPEIIERIFDPFFTTKPLGQGTGLGLSMIHGFVRQSGGQVRVYSEVGEGTTMCLYLPRYMGSAAEAASPPAATIEAGAARGESVLVIDDEVLVRMLMVEVLEEAGYHVLEAGDGPSGLRLLKEYPNVKLLVTDVGLPGGLNGRQVADAARQLQPKLSILFVTGYAENAAIGHGYLDPGMTVMTKPFEFVALVDKVRAILDAH